MPVPLKTAPFWAPLRDELGAAWRVWRLGCDSMRALAALDDEDLCNLSEVGRRLRKAARRDGHAPPPERPSTSRQSFNARRKIVAIKGVSPSIVRASALAAAIAALCAPAEPTRAADIRLLSAAAMQTIFKTIGGEFERTSGHRLVFVYTTMGAITQRVLAGERPRTWSSDRRNRSSSSSRRTGSMPAAR